MRAVERRQFVYCFCEGWLWASCFPVVAAEALTLPRHMARA